MKSSFSYPSVHSETSHIEYSRPHRKKKIQSLPKSTFSFGELVKSIHNLVPESNFRAD